MIGSEQIELLPAPLPPAFPNLHPIPDEKQLFALRERDRLKSLPWKSKVLGSSEQLVVQSQQYQADQDRASSTCIVSLYPEGMGLRVERRKPGYSWEGATRKRVELKESQGTKTIANKQKKKRGRCRGATPSSMARFRDSVYKVSRSEIPVMLTLGWPKSQTPNDREAKRCIHAFIEALSRRYKRSCGFWKLEFGEASGLPHYHMLLWGAKPWHRWVAQTWYRICSTGNPDHLKAGTRVEKLRSYRGTLAYCGKNYCAKTSRPPFGNWGRVWGCFRRALIPWASSITVEAPWRVGMWYARTMRRYMKAQTGGRLRRGGRGRVLWRTTDFAAQWLRVLEWADTDPRPSSGPDCPF